MGQELDGCGVQRGGTRAHWSNRKEGPSVALVLLG